MLITVQPTPSWQLSLAQFSPSMLDLLMSVFGNEKYPTCAISKTNTQLQNQFEVITFHFQTLKQLAPKLW